MKDGKLKIAAGKNPVVHNSVLKLFINYVFMIG